MPVIEQKTTNKNKVDFDLNRLDKSKTTIFSKYPNKFGGIVMRFMDEMKDFLTSVPGKLLLFLFGIEVITLIWLFQWP